MKQPEQPKTTEQAKKPRLVPADQRFQHPKPCPYCGGVIRFNANAWEQDEDGSWLATDLDIECENEPPIDSRQWREWDRQHGRADYNEAWHLLHDRIIESLRGSYRFTVE